VSVDLAGIITYLNPVAERMTGWPAAEAIGRPLPEVMRLVDADTREQAPDPLTQAMRSDADAAVGDTCLLVSRDGRESAIEDTASPIHDRTGRVTGAVIVFHDVGAARELSRQMSQLAQHDVLTGLPNRMLLADRLDRAIAAARRHGHPLAVLFLDLDHFKHINDRLGHAAGDQVLQTVARRLVASVRRSDTVSRLGGDEFVVLLSEVTCADDASFTASNLLAAIAVPQRVENWDLQVTTSLGIGLYPADGLEPEILLRKADFAMLRAKAQRPAWPHLTRAGTTFVRVAENSSRVQYASEIK
jgi:diguanylate cyclase (GGDEF)-like protein/PAS domain S-box-containing protein